MAWCAGMLQSRKLVAWCSKQPTCLPVWNPSNRGRNRGRGARAPITVGPRHQSHMPIWWGPQRERTVPVGASVQAAQQAAAIDGMPVAVWTPPVPRGSVSERMTRSGTCLGHACCHPSLTERAPLPTPGCRLRERGMQLAHPPIWSPTSLPLDITPARHHPRSTPLLLDTTSARHHSTPLSLDITSARHHLRATLPPLDTTPARQHSCSTSPPLDITPARHQPRSTSPPQASSRTCCSGCPSACATRSCRTRATSPRTTGSGAGGGSRRCGSLAPWVSVTAMRDCCTSPQPSKLSFAGGAAQRQQCGWLGVAAACHRVL